MKKLLFLLSISCYGQTMIWPNGIYWQPTTPGNLPPFCSVAGVGSGLCTYFNLNDGLLHIVSSTKDSVYGIVGPAGPPGPQGTQGIPGPNGPPGSSAGSQILIVPLKSQTVGANGTLYGSFGWASASSSLFLPYSGTVISQGGTLSNLCVSTWGPVQPSTGSLTISFVYVVIGTTLIQSGTLQVIIPPSTGGGVYCNNIDTLTLPSMSSVAVKMSNTAALASASIGGITVKFVGN